MKKVAAVLFLLSLAPMATTLASASDAQMAATATATATATASATATYTIGELLDDPKFKAILDKNLPGFSGNAQVFLARGMTLRAVQPMASDQISTEALDKIDADMAALPANGSSSGK